MTGNEKKKHSTMNGRRKNEKIFFYSVLAIPVIQFLIFYIGVNFNSILLAFKDIELDLTGKDYVEKFVGFDNFAKVFQDFGGYILRQGLKNSFSAYVVGLLVGTVGALLFSFYIYKQYLFAGFFKVVLFLPSIISSIAMTLMFRYFVEGVYPALVLELTGEYVDGLLVNPDTSFATILFYCQWVGFGSGILMYTGAMNSISESVVEAAKLEGITPMREFFTITLPLIYPTLVTFLVVGLAGAFTNQLNLFSFYGDRAEYQLYTFGYYMYIETLAGTENYPYLAAMGLCLTAVVAPVTIVARWLLEKFGPSTN